SDLMVLVARTAPRGEGPKRTEGLSLFLVDLREAKGIERTRIRTMFNSQTYELFLNDVEVPAGNRIGAEGHGFEPLLHVLNPERILIASECIGDARWFIDRSVEYAKGRVVSAGRSGATRASSFLSRTRTRASSPRTSCDGMRPPCTRPMRIRRKSASTRTSRNTSHRSARGARQTWRWMSTGA